MNLKGISVLIATRNRAEILRRTLEDFCVLLDPGIPWELLIVDNGSSDSTRLVVESFEDRLPVRYCYEGTPGKVNALNSGVPQAQYRLIVMTDDDITPCEEWLCAYAEAATSYPECSFFGGDIYADTSGVVLPSWALKPDGRPAQWAVWSRKMDPGSPDRWVFAGGNVAYRSALFSKYGLFPKHLGHVDGKLAGGEETWFQSKLHAGGEQPWYVSSAWVRHRQRQDEFSVWHQLRRAWYTCTAQTLFSNVQDSSKLRTARGIAQDACRVAFIMVQMIKAICVHNQGEVVYGAARLACLLGRIVAHSRSVLMSMTSNDKGA